MEKRGKDFFPSSVFDALFARGLHTAAPSSSVLSELFPGGAFTALFRKVQLFALLEIFLDGEGVLTDHGRNGDKQVTRFLYIWICLAFPNSEPMNDNLI